MRTEPSPFRLGLPAAAIAIVALMVTSSVGTISSRHPGPSSPATEPLPVLPASSPRATLSALGTSSAPSGVSSWAGTTAATLLPNYNGSLPGNFESTVDDWEVGTPAAVPMTHTIWWPTSPVTVGGSPLPVVAPALLYSQTEQAFVGVDRWVSNTSAFAFDPENRLLYAADPLNSTVFAVNLTTGRPNGESYRVGDAPSALLYDPTIKELMVANSGSSSITVIDPALSGPSAIVWPNLPVGKGPIAFALDTVDGWLYIADGGAKLVSRLNTSNFTQPAINTGLYLGAPSGIAYSASSGMVAVAIPSAENLTIISAPTGFVVPTGVDVGSGYGSVVTAANNSWFILANGTGNDLAFVKASSPFTVQSRHATVGEGPDRLVNLPLSSGVLTWNNRSRNVSEIDAGFRASAGSQGTLGPEPTLLGYSSALNATLVADATSDQLLTLGPYTGQTLRPPVQLAGTPMALVVDPRAGTVDVGEIGEVQEFNASTGLLVAQSAPLAGPCSPLVLDSATGLLWVGRQSQGEIIALDTPGLAAAGVTAGVQVVGSEPFSVVLDPSTGNLYATNSTTGKVVAFSGSDGSPYGTPITVGAGALALVFDPSDGLVYSAGQTLVAIDPGTDATTGSPIGIGAHAHVGGSPTTRAGRQST